jgi:hypothetical protein
MLQKNTRSYWVTIGQINQCINPIKALVDIDDKTLLCSYRQNFNLIIEESKYFTDLIKHRLVNVASFNQYYWRKYL